MIPEAHIASQLSYGQSTMMRPPLRFPPLPGQNPPCCGSRGTFSKILKPRESFLFGNIYFLNLDTYHIIPTCHSIKKHPTFKFIPLHFYRNHYYTLQSNPSPPPPRGPIFLRNASIKSQISHVSYLRQPTYDRYSSNTFFFHVRARSVSPLWSSGQYSILPPVFSFSFFLFIFLSCDRRVKRCELRGGIGSRPGVVSNLGSYAGGKTL